MTMIAGLECENVSYLLADSHVTDVVDSVVLDANCKFFVHGKNALVVAGLLGVAYRFYRDVPTLFAELADVEDDMVVRMHLMEFFTSVEDFNNGCEVIACVGGRVYQITGDGSVLRSPGALLTGGSGAPYLSGAFAMEDRFSYKGLKKAANRATWVSASCAAPIKIWNSETGFSDILDT